MGQDEPRNQFEVEVVEKEFSMRLPPQFLSQLKMGLIAIGLMVSAALLAPTIAMADSITPNRIVKTFELDDDIEFQVVLVFEDATGLAADSLEISAQLVNPQGICGACNRLPANVFVPGRFPVLLSITQDQTGLSFAGSWSLELITENLQFAANTPLRLFRAGSPLDNFEDITLSTGLGSFRVRGIGGSFSQFIVGADLRPIGPVIASKLDRLDNILTNQGPSIDPGVLSNLTALLTDAQNAVDSGDLVQARRKIGELTEAVIQASGNGIPDVWDSTAMTPLSIAGRLRGALAATNYSLSVGNTPDEPESGSVIRTFDLGGGLEGTVILRFENSFDIDLIQNAGLGFSAELINPDDILSRLPVGTFIPDDFPVLIRVNPAIGQSFSGAFTLELITEALDFVASTPLRLFKAPDGGAFQDISETVGVGSFRVRGIGGSFSDFVVVSDLRDTDDLLLTKFDRLEAFLDTNGNDIPTEVRSLFDQARGAWEAEQFGTAIDLLQDFVDAVNDNLDSIPAVWLANGSTLNVAGTATGEARSLRFSLVLKDTPLAVEPGDVNNDGSVDVMDVFLLIDQVFGTGAPELPLGQLGKKAPQDENSDP